MASRHTSGPIPFTGDGIARSTSAEEGAGREWPLSGGRSTRGVVRRGDTVRRPAGPASPYVAQLLGLLERRGFTGAPRHLGTDAHGRDILTYLPGEVPARFRRWSDPQVAAAGLLLARLHAATRGTPLAGRRALVCHGDAGPNNAVFRGTSGEWLPVALIDFDRAAPGDALDDLGYAAWTWCVSSRPGAVAAVAQAAQVRVLADAYGLDAWGRRGLVAAMLSQQGRNARWWHRAGPGPWNHEQRAARTVWSVREQAFTVAHRELFEAALH